MQIVVSSFYSHNFSKQVYWKKIIIVIKYYLKTVKENWFDRNYKQSKTVKRKMFT